MSTGLFYDFKPIDDPIYCGAPDRLKLAAPTTPKRPPGTEFEYADVNPILANATLGTDAGMALEQFAEQKLFKPMGMKHCAGERADAKGLVSPYVQDVQQKIIANYAGIGIDCVAEQHLDLSVNFAFSEGQPETLQRMLREVARQRPAAMTIMCTNLHGAQLVDELERELGIPIYDSVATVVWKALKTIGVDPRELKGWGHLFQQAA